MSGGDQSARGDRQSRFSARASLALIYAAAQFIVLTAVAMLVYPGGNDADPAAAGYRFTRNFFSDLGSTEAYSGDANTICMALFVIALVAVGLALIGFGFAVRTLRDGRRGRVAAVVAPVAATLSGVAFVGIAATPLDVAGAAHEQFTNAAFGFLLVFVVSLCVLEFRAGWNASVTVPNVVYVVLLAVYVYLLFWGPSTDTTGGLVFMVVAQKVIVYTSILNLGWQAIGVYRHAGPRRDAATAAAA